MSAAGGEADGSDGESAGRLRAEMGRELARRRRDAGLSQTELAARAGRYSQSVVAHAEKGRDDVGEGFWRAADRVLGTGGLFTSRHEQVRGCLEPGRRAAVRPEEDPVVRCAAVLRREEPDRAAAGYRRLGWPVAVDGNLVELMAGRTADVLEAPRAAGMVATGAWMESGGAEGAVRGLPRLPPPEGALAVIDAGERWFFLVRSGFPLPWRDVADPGPAVAGGAEITWHSAGGRVLLPPSKAGQALARWAHLPCAALRPPPPLAVLDLLGWALAATRVPGQLRLPGGAAAAGPRL